MSAAPVILLVGPTASGKSALAMAIAERLPVEVVNVDAAQVYRGMDIGTAKAGAADRRSVPHHLLDIRSPHESYSAAEFCADARRCVAEIHARGHIPLLCGGTTFYFAAFEHGLSPLPAADPGLRARIAADAALKGWPAMHRQLAAVDPGLAARIEPNDGQRVQRALEIHALTGRPPSVLMAERGSRCRAPMIRLALADPCRARLHRRIEARFRDMLARGLVDETRELFGTAVDPRLPAARVVGYRQVIEYLAGRTDHAGMVERAVAATRQLAKRQLTWMRHQRGWIWLDGGSGPPVEALLECLGSALTTSPARAAAGGVAVRRAPPQSDTASA
jgi:tRNA dimethylallyltransferase